MLPESFPSFLKSYIFVNPDDLLIAFTPLIFSEVDTVRFKLTILLFSLFYCSPAFSSLPSFGLFGHFQYSILNWVLCFYIASFF